MGLDMYLSCNSKALTGHVCDREAQRIDETEDISDELRQSLININNRRRREGEIMYWRKANAIHQWFVNNCQDENDDCRTAEVSIKDLKHLLKNINDVLDNHSLASELLPTQSGFFFGSTQYDEYYYEELERTKKELEFIFSHLDILKSKWDFEYSVCPEEPDWEVRFFYQSSW